MTAMSSHWPFSPVASEIPATERLDRDSLAALQARRLTRLIADIFDLEAGLGDDGRHLASLRALRDRLQRLAEKAETAEDSPERSRARRVLRTITSGGSEREQDPEYRALLREYALRGRAP